MKASGDKASGLRQFWRSQINKGGVHKHETGITGLDELLEGGLPQGRVTLISAGPGCGKTVFLNEFLYRGATGFGEAGLFLTFEERPADIIQNLKNFNWPQLDELLQKGKLSFIDVTPGQQDETQLGEVDWFGPILARLEFMAAKTGAKRLAVDNLNSIFMRYGTIKSQDDLRDCLFHFADRIKALGLTTLITTESLNCHSTLSTYGVEEFVASGFIELSSTRGQWGELRHMQVRKMRGCGYRSGSVRFQIGAEGMKIYPRIPIDTSIGETDFDKRKQFGVPFVDQALGGGIPEGQLALITGNTGTGKTTLGLHFIQEGVKQGESTIWLALEEPVNVLAKTAQVRGWQLKPLVEKGMLQFVTSPLLDVSADKLLYDLIDAVNKTNAKRVIVDSISSLESSDMDQDAIRSFMIQLSGYAKTRGLTVLLNYLTDSAFGAEKGQLFGTLQTNAMRMSSIVDGIIMLRYVERDSRVQKLMNILKLRGCWHERRILHYELGDEGFVVDQGIDESAP